MQKFIAAALSLIGTVSCNNNNPEQNFSTVDSNVAGSPDSLPASLHLDSHRVDTSFPVAMDSAGATVKPQDTGYLNNKQR